MPKKMSINPKAEASRERELATKQAAKVKQNKEIEDAKWEDEKNNKFLLKQQKEAEAKKLQAEKNAIKKALEAQDNAANAKKVLPPKLTMANIQSVRSRYELEEEQRRAAIEASKSKLISLPDEIAPNLNIRKCEMEDHDIKETLIDARSVTDALSQLHLSSSQLAELDKHPEKRSKAAFLAYEEKNLPLIKAEYPTLKFSQLKDRLWDQWLKAPENPLNK